MTGLPALRLSRARTPVESPVELADGVLRWLGATPSDAESLVAALGWSYREVPLSAHRGGQDALLVPRPAGGFDIVVDPDVSSRQYWMPAARRPSAAFCRSTTLFRAAHEVGHSFFYTNGSPPTRRVAPVADEERFCDLFAAALLVGERTPPDARTVAAVARRHGGNLELAALWAAAVAPRAVVRISTSDGVAMAFGAPRRSSRAVETCVGGRTAIRVAA